MKVHIFFFAIKLLVCIWISKCPLITHSVAIKIQFLGVKICYLFKPCHKILVRKTTKKYKVCVFELIWSKGKNIVLRCWFCGGNKTFSTSKISKGSTDSQTGGFISTHEGDRSKLSGLTGVTSNFLLLK